MRRPPQAHRHANRMARRRRCGHSAPFTLRFLVRLLTTDALLLV